MKTTKHVTKHGNMKRCFMQYR